MADRTLAGLVRLIDKRMAALRATFETMIDQGEVSNVSGSAGAVPTCTVDGDDAEVFEPYGLAGQASSGDAMLLAPGGDSDNLTALLSSVAGRPATQPGDKALWTAGGHVIYLDDDGGLAITSKDGAVIELPVNGKIKLTAAALADIEIYVDALQSVNIGDALAESLTKWQALSAAMTALLNAGVAFVGTPADPLGENAGLAFAAALAAWNIAIGANSPATTKAKGT